MKKLLLTAAIAACLAPQANAMSPYVGLQAGVINVNNGSDIQSVFNKMKNHNTTLGDFGTRVYIGNQLNSRFGVELGYTALPKSIYRGDDGLVRLKLNGHSYDVTGKLSHPVNERLDVYGLAGIVLVTNEGKLDVFDVGVTESAQQYHYKFGLGVAYKLNEKFTAGLEYSYIMGEEVSVDVAQGTGALNDNPATSMLSVGVTYSF